MIGGRGLPHPGGRRQARRAAALAVGLLSLSAIAQGTQLPERIVPTRSDPDFGDATGPLRTLLLEQAPLAGPQHFCVIGYTHGRDKIAYVHWRERHKLITWWGGYDPRYRDEAIVRSNRQLDLDTDVVPTEKDIGGSTYLVTRAWVRRKLSDCAAHGTRYVVAA